jgi:hypothetical protein
VVQLSLWDKRMVNVFLNELLESYMQGLYDLPTLALMLHDIPKLDVADFIQRSIPHRDRYLAVERIKNNTKLPIDGVSRLEKMFLVECDNMEKGGIQI